MASYALGAFILDLRSGQLRKGTDAIPIPPKVFDLLLYLVENQGRLVKHHELLDALWPDSDVGAASLSRAIADLRRVLNDDAADPQYVQTVTRRGYRLMAPVNKLREEHQPPSPFSLLYKGDLYELQMGDNIIGRSDESVVPIHSPAVSRQHARLKVTEAGATLYDLGSKNGSYVGETRVRGEAGLNEGDEIRIGPMRLVLVRSERDPTTITDGTS